MEIRTVVFDFDGTLIESNQLKYDAFFGLFPADEFHTRIIRGVLSEIVEQSRYVILDAILRRLAVADVDIDGKVKELSGRYNEIVLAGAKECPEKTGAKDMLDKLSKLRPLYVSSTTPDAALKEIIKYRGWDGYFQGVFGYPFKKTETLRQIIKQEKIEPDQVMVVGDGESDRISAMNNGCKFVRVTKTFRLCDLVDICL